MDSARRWLVGIGVVASLTAASGPGAHEQGGGMKDDGVVPVLRALSPEDEKGFDRLAQAITAPCQRDAGELIQLLRPSDTPDARKAATELIRLGNHAFPVLLDSLHRDSPEDYVWEAQLLTDIALDSRRQLIKELMTMLADKRDVKMPEVPAHTEEKFKPRRVCDEAYLMLRKLLETQEGEEAQYLNERMFLNWSNKERDQEIHRWKTTRKWVPLTQ